METGQKNYYQVLGVSENASPDEIKKVYRKLAMQYHPDRTQHLKDKKAAEQKFKEISEAYYVLGDPKRKTEYDQFRKSGFRQSDYSRAGTGAGAQGFAQGFDFEEFLNAIRGGGRGSGGDVGLDDLFGNIFSAQPRGRTTQRVYRYSPGDDETAGQFGQEKVNTDVELTAKISKEQAQKGGKILVRISDGKSISVTIPKPAQNNQILRVRDHGKVCPCCDKKGDLLIKIQIKS